MKIMTSQRDECVKLLFAEEYVPDFEKSDYAEEERYRTAYKIILSELERKTNIIARNNESCVWGWVGRIFMGFYDFHFDETSLFFDISEKEVVLIDYDKYMLYVEGETEEMDFFVGNLDEADCVQCVFWVTSIEMKRIEKILPLDELKTFCRQNKAIYGDEPDIDLILNDLIVKNGQPIAS